MHFPILIAAFSLCLSFDSRRFKKLIKYYCVSSDEHKYYLIIYSNNLWIVFLNENYCMKIFDIKYHLTFTILIILKRDYFLYIFLFSYLSFSIPLLPIDVRGSIAEEWVLTFESLPKATNRLIWREASNWLLMLRSSTGPLLTEI